MMYRDGGKRVFDLILSLFALALFALPILMAIVAIKITSPGPAFFFQARVGRYEQVFRIFKLRTMTVRSKRKVAVQVGPGDADLIAVGRFLRRFKIDEMPQVLNVIKGEMSIVGPRPCVEEIRDSMPSWARRRFDVLPGLTGLAQTKGNVAMSWERRWEYDVRYVDRMSFAMDFWLVVKTVLVVVVGEDRFGETL